MTQKSRTFSMGILFESGLGFVGIAIAWLTGIVLADRLQPTQTHLERGLFATLPMFAMLGIMLVSRWPPCVEIRQEIETLVQRVFSTGSWFDVALMSVAAGVGEEILFRGALQPWIASWTTELVALAVVSLLFGLAHAVSTTYFVLATVIGAYFGWLAMEYDDLVAPIVAHSVYDFVAILVVRYRTGSA